MKVSSNPLISLLILLDVTSQLIDPVSVKLTLLAKGTKMVLLEDVVGYINSGLNHRKHVIFPVHVEDNFRLLECLDGGLDLAPIFCDHFVISSQSAHHHLEEVIRRQPLESFEKEVNIISLHGSLDFVLSLTLHLLAQQ